MRLARWLSLPFFDTDQEIEKRYTPLSCAEIFRALGEREFRALEREVLLALPEVRAVVAVGGGTVLDPENVQILRTKGTLLYVRERKEILRERFLRHPLASGESFESLYEQRIPLYESIISWQAINLVSV